MPRAEVGGLPRWLNGKESTRQAGDLGSVPGMGRSPGGGTGNPLQYAFGTPWLQSMGSQKSST